MEIDITPINSVRKINFRPLCRGEDYQVSIDNLLIIFPQTKIFEFSLDNSFYVTSNEPEKDLIELEKVVVDDEKGMTENEKKMIEHKEEFEKDWEIIIAETRIEEEKEDLIDLAEKYKASKELSLLEEDSLMMKEKEFRKLEIEGKLVNYLVNSNLLFFRWRYQVEKA